MQSPEPKGSRSEHTCLELCLSSKEAQAPDSGGVVSSWGARDSVQKHKITTVLIFQAHTLRLFYKLAMLKKKPDLHVNL